MGNRAIIIVLDSAGIGALPDAADFGDLGTHTLGHVYEKTGMKIPNMLKLGLGNIEDSRLPKVDNPTAGYGRLMEKTKAKDTTSGHWEIAGLVMDPAFVTYNEGFPAELVDKLEEAFGSKILVNKPYSGTEVLMDYGREHMETGCPIVYTSADSVLQIAAHEDVIPLERLYELCEMAYELAKPFHVGRIIARPFVGTYPNFTRTSGRRDYSVPPVGDTILDVISRNGLNVYGIGKIEDIFSHRGLTGVNHTTNNKDGIEATMKAMKEVGDGLIFVNLVDFDMLYGHRNDPAGYGAALEYFDQKLPEILSLMKPDDLLIITADHGCDPTTPGTDHTREHIPVLALTPNTKGVDLGTGGSFCDIAATVSEHLGISWPIGESFLGRLS